MSNEIKQQDNWAEQIVSIARDVFATKKGPNYFLVTVADKGVLYIDDTTSEHYDLERHVDWDKVGDAVPCHVNGCGDTLAGVYVASITGPLKMNRQDAIRRALTAAQISLRSPKNVPDQLPSELQAWLLHSGARERTKRQDKSKYCNHTYTKTDQNWHLKYLI